MKIKWKTLREAINRVNGVQPWGISWETKELDVTKVHKLFVFLEDKRVLYAVEEWEFMPHVIQSVTNIRQYLVENILQETESESPLYEAAKAMRVSCVKFLELVEKMERNEYGHYSFAESNYAIADHAIVQLRKRFGEQLLSLASKYKVDVEENLASIIYLSPNYDPELLKIRW